MGFRKDEAFAREWPVYNNGQITLPLCLLGYRIRVEIDGEDLGKEYMVKSTGPGAYVFLSERFAGKMAKIKEVVK